MVCIQCGQKTQIINSRPQRRTNQTWRRRKCVSCSSIFTTNESADYSALWRVRGAHKHLEPFSRDKLFLSLLRSCEHRSAALDDAAGLTDTVIKKLLSQTEDGLLEAYQIAQTAQVALNRFDKAASVHYAAFHSHKNGLKKI